VLADEPTSALDSLHQSRLLALLARRRAAQGFARLWVTHDLAVAATFAVQVLVLSAGEIVERGSPAEVFTCPSHPATRALVAAQPRLDAVLAAASARGVA
ncbi:MAG: ABC transporter ATP-binding protein, partial [Terriglobales bacterium]